MRPLRLLECAVNRVAERVLGLACVCTERALSVRPGFGSLGGMLQEVLGSGILMHDEAPATQSSDGSLRDTLGDVGYQLFVTLCRAVDASRGLTTEDEAQLCRRLDAPTTLESLVGLKKRNALLLHKLYVMHTPAGVLRCAALRCAVMRYDAL